MAAVAALGMVASAAVTVTKVDAVEAVGLAAADTGARAKAPVRDRAGLPLGIPFSSLPFFPFPLSILAARGLSLAPSLFPFGVVGAVAKLRVSTTGGGRGGGLTHGFVHAKWVK